MVDRLDNFLFQLLFKHSQVNKAIINVVGIV